MQSKTSNKHKAPAQPRTNVDIAIAAVVILLIAANIYFSDVALLLISVGFVALSILLSRRLFPKFISENREAFGLVIEMVAVVFGVYMATTVSNNSNER